MDDSTSRAVRQDSNNIRQADREINALDNAGSLSDIDVAQSGGEQCGSRREPSRQTNRPQSEFTGSGQWSNFVWLPCADGKLRRAPDDTIELVDGLHRSVLAALGNSIVPRVAYQIIKAIIEAEFNDI
jgi:hypothetical protein